MSNTQRYSQRKSRRRGWIFGNSSNPAGIGLGLLILRVMTGIIFAYHGAGKAFGWFGGSGFGATVDFVGAIGFPVPAFFAVMLVIAEFGGGIALILGVATRPAAALTALVIVVALATVHAGDGFAAMHAQQMLLAASLALLAAGGGPWSFWPGRFRHNGRGWMRS